MHLYNALPAIQNLQDPGLNTALFHMAKAVASQAVEEHMARLAKEIERDQQPYLQLSLELYSRSLSCS